MNQIARAVTSKVGVVPARGHRSFVAARARGRRFAVVTKSSQDPKDVGGAGESRLFRTRFFFAFVSDFIPVLLFSSSEADEFLGGAVGKFISSLTEFAANSPINQGKM